MRFEQTHNFIADLIKAFGLDPTDYGAIEFGPFAPGHILTVKLTRFVKQDEADAIVALCERYALTRLADPPTENAQPVAESVAGGG